MFRNNSIKQDWRVHFMRYAPLFIWICVILFLSSGQASMPQTSRFIKPLLEFLFPSASAETLIIYHGYIRKLAHFTEYAIVGFFAARAFSTSSIDVFRRYWVIISILLAASIAGLDEFNQSLDSSRTASIWDVLLDIFGGVTAIAVYYFIKRK